jgi:hypothetical protein
MLGMRRRRVNRGLHAMQTASPRRRKNPSFQAFLSLASRLVQKAVCRSLILCGLSPPFLLDRSLAHGYTF